MGVPLGCACHPLPVCSIIWGWEEQGIHTWTGACVGLLQHTGMRIGGQVGKQEENGEKCGRDEAVPRSSGVPRGGSGVCVTNFRPDSANSLALFLWFCLAALWARAERRRRVSPPGSAVMSFDGCRTHACCSQQPCASLRLRFAFHIMGIIYQIVNDMLSFFYVSSTYHFNQLKIVKLDYFP